MLKYFEHNGLLNKIAALTTLNLGMLKENC